MVNETVRKDILWLLVWLNENTKYFSSPDVTRSWMIWKTKRTCLEASDGQCSSETQLFEDLVHLRAGGSQWLLMIHLATQFCTASSNAESLDEWGFHTTHAYSKHGLTILLYATFFACKEHLTGFKCFLLVVAKEFLLMVDWIQVKSGIPQGSVLRLLLFILYIDSLHHSVANSTLKMFADDATVYRAVSNVSMFQTVHSCRRIWPECMIGLLLGRCDWILWNVRLLIYLISVLFPSLPTLLMVGLFHGNLWFDIWEYASTPDPNWHGLTIVKWQP